MIVDHIKIVEDIFDDIENENKKKKKSFNNLNYKSPQKNIIGK